MIAAPRYLLWARRYFGKIPFDLATSGIPRPSAEELGHAVSPDDLTGSDRLCAAIATFNGVPNGEAIAALGTTHALWLAYAALISPGDEVLVEEPGYEPLWRIAEGFGARVVRFERPVRERFALDPGRIEKALTPKTRVVAITNLHNPGGVRVSGDVTREVAKICEARGVYLLVDEVYAPFVAIDGKATNGLIFPNGVWSGSARHLAPNILTTSSLTKCFGLGYERVGWLLGPPEIVARADAAILSSVGHLPIQHANLGVHAFSRLNALADRARRLNSGKRAIVEAWVASRPELTWSAPESGLFGFASTTHPGDLTPLLEAGADDHGVIAAAGTFFGVPNGLRISWSIARERLEEALARLGRVLPRA